MFDRLPDDLSVVAGAVADEPTSSLLADVTLRGRDRSAPLMTLFGADDVISAMHDDQWVKLTAEPFVWTVEPVSQAQADAWFDDNQPAPVAVAVPDTTVTGLVDLDDVGLADIAVVGGAAAHAAELRANTSPEEVTMRRGFVVPMARYREFLQQGGFDVTIDQLLADPQFQSDPAYRGQRLDELTDAMLNGPVDNGLSNAIVNRILAEFAGASLLVTGSPNAGSIIGFSGVGLSESRTGNFPDIQILDTLRAVWASLWSARAYEEREHAGIDHTDVAMAVVIVSVEEQETATGRALTANIFDPAPGGEDAFYIEVRGDEATKSGDELSYFHAYNNQPATYYARANPDGSAILSRSDLFELGTALARVRSHFAATYQPPTGYGQLPMVVEFARTTNGVRSQIVITSVRPYAGSTLTAP